MALDIQHAPQEGIDVTERGKDSDGNSIALDRRLFMQFLAFGKCRQPELIIQKLEEADFSSALVLYLDINDPYGIGILAAHEDPEFYVSKWRAMLNEPPFVEVRPKPSLTMFGRTYSIGYENDLEETLITSRNAW